MRPTHDGDRAVATALGYALVLAVAALLISGLVFAATSFTVEQQERTIRGELGVVGEQFVADLSTADRLAASSDGGTVRLTVRLPREIAGTTYTVRVIPGNPNRIELETMDPAVRVELTVRTTVSLDAVSLTGGRFTFAYDGSTLEVRND